MTTHPWLRLFTALLFTLLLGSTVAPAQTEEPIDLVPPAASTEAEPAPAEPPPQPEQQPAAPEASEPASEPTPSAPPSAGPVDLNPETVNAAEFTGEALPKEPSPLVLRLQVLLDRAGFSPGVVDGIMGLNVAKAIAAAELVAGFPVDGVLDQDVWLLVSVNQGPVLVGYAITPEDLAGPYIPDLPTDFAALAKLPRSAYRSPAEMLAEKFHMDIDLLAALNPGADFAAPGTQIVVADIGAPKSRAEVRKLVADKAIAQLRGYDANGKLVVAYPATIGSQALPSPSGTHRVRAIARNAAYYYRPDVNFKQGDNTEPLTLPPGPNNPIGTTWIDLTEPTYGIHGTPEPSKIDKTNSHGCVRLTNWDVEELAGLIEKGVPVEFR